MTFLPPKLSLSTQCGNYGSMLRKLPEPLSEGSECEEPLKYIMYIVCWGLQPRIMLPGLINVVLT